MEAVILMHMGTDTTLRNEAQNGPGHRLGRYGTITTERAKQQRIHEWSQSDGKRFGA